MCLSRTPRYLATTVDPLPRPGCSASLREGVRILVEAEVPFRDLAIRVNRLSAVMEQKKLRGSAQEAAGRGMGSATSSEIARQELWQQHEAGDFCMSAGAAPCPFPAPSCTDDKHLCCALLQLRPPPRPALEFAVALPRLLDRPVGLEPPVVQHRGPRAESLR